MHFTNQSSKKREGSVGVLLKRANQPKYLPPETKKYRQSEADGRGSEAYARTRMSRYAVKLSKAVAMDAKVAKPA